MKSERLISHTSASTLKEVAYEFWNYYFLSTNGFSINIRIQQMRQALRWKLQGQKFFVLGSVTLHGLCSTHLSRKLARYRSMSAFLPKQTLSHGNTRQSLATIQELSTFIWIAEKKGYGRVQRQGMGRKHRVDYVPLHRGCVLWNNYFMGE